MTRHLKWIVAASLSVTGFAMTGCERSNTNTRSDANNPNPTVTNRDEAAQTAGSKLPGDQIGAVDLTNIYNSLGNTLKQATSKGEFDDVVDHFDKPDRDRYASFKEMKFADMDGQIDQFRKDWNAKYSHDLDIDNSKVFENWARVTKDGETKDWTKVNVVLPAGHGLPELTVPMLKHQMTWKIDVPDQMSGEQLKSNLMAHLNHFGTMKDKWDANELESKRAPADSIDRAMAALEALPFDAEAVVRTFDGASRTEVAYVSSRLKYLADLEAIARTECQNILATTTVAIERAQVLKARLATLAADDDTGESVDCVR